MITIKPFRGLRPADAFKEQVPSPPYDVLSSAEARQMAAENPKSFLHINKPEIDLPEHTDPYAELVYNTGRDNLQRFIREGTLVQDAQESIYIYRLTWRGHQQTGWFCLSSVEDYDRGLIKKHELTRKEKEEDRTHLIDVMNAQVGPVFLMYQAQDTLDRMLETQTANTPVVDFTSDDEVHHQLWMISDPEELQRIVGAFARLDYTYVADGHHRSASASNINRLRSQSGSDREGNDSHRWFLSVIFPHDQLKILPYNRVVQDLNGHSVPDFLQQVGEKFMVSPLDAQPGELAPHQFGMYLEGRWYELRPASGLFDEQDPLDSLDVNILTKQVLVPLLNIADPRTDPRIDFVGGIRGNAELEKLVNSGDFAVAFALSPTTVDMLMSVADADQIMPPKSTWFEPKLRSGMVSYLL